MKWNPNLYDQKHGFVSQYGEDVIKLLAPLKNELILDLGCGTGDLTNRIQLEGATVMGTDFSEEMIRKAKEKYPSIKFTVEDARNIDYKETLDAVFSNAALHWMLEKEAVIKSVYKSLKKGGRFVAEFGGKGNVEKIRLALKNILAETGNQEIAEKEIWYFPSISEYATLLEKNGFQVVYAVLFERETLLADKDGVKNWLKMFATSYLENLDPETAENILDEVQEKIRPTNLRDDNWYADYVRLRFIAIKE
ncbi:MULTISPECIES: class I SAM-dependent methyltransferase [Sphingobacterium]|uniref:Methyltransferase domain-containing protein n=1 Tax=Sphingobacterium tenebrionis TaxID=3111775 RepID=A0ABU8I5N9_9SPHI|nr:class I SAM-dependent methyltransferase [Sphingobacterium sp. 1.A.4]